jgi:small-conductance mechanosensitive channel
MIASSACGSHARALVAVLAVVASALGGPSAGASPASGAALRPAQEQEQPPPEEREAVSPDSFTQPTETVEVSPRVRDPEIRRRLLAVFEASKWFEALEVEVTEGVVVLRGETDDDERRDWATEVASHTEGVVGVANRMHVEVPLEWDLAPAWEEVRKVSEGAIARLPLVLAGLLLVVLSLVLGRLAVRVARPLLARRIDNGLLVQVAGTLLLVAFAVLGVYLFLKVAGLSGLAATVLGGTGLFGLAIGIAFRDIAENFLASVLISAKRPFRLGDLIRVDDLEGYVRSVTTRGTLLVTVDGNHVHVPNSTVYKSNIVNFTDNPSRRFEFSVGIDYEDSIERAQEVCLGVLQAHEQVLGDPEPLVLVNELGASSVNLRIYYWVDATKSNALKVRSSVLRLTKAAIVEAGLTMPDDAREVIFPRGVPVHQVEAPSSEAPRPADEPVVTKTAAEGDQETEAETVDRQARQSAELDLGESLLEETPS